MAAKRAATEKKRTRENEPEGKSAADAPVGSAADGQRARPSYVVFARRFRPRLFSDVVGQPAATGALRQALLSGRVAQAYLFCGPRGVGKTSLARIVAKALNCLNGKGPGGVAEEPCNECEACLSIQEGRALDVIEMDAATNRGIEEIRGLRENVSIAPAELRYKVYIIDEVHMLTREAWNAFLKTLEEPPAHVKFIFATTDPNNVPETILSRCQRFDLRRIGVADIVTRLKQICALEKIEYEEAALSRIAGLAKGGLRDAESLLDQAVNLAQGKVSDAAVRELSGAAPDELIAAILADCAAGHTAEALSKAHQALEAGADPEDLLSALIELLRGALLCRVCGENSPLLEGQTHLKAAYAELGRSLSADQNMMLVQLFAAARRQLRDAAQTRLPLEMALIRAARAGELVDLGKLVSALESSAGAPARPQPAPHPPNREGSRPNSLGRPAGTVENRSAATNDVPESRDRGPQPPAAGLQPVPPVLQPPVSTPPAPVSGLEPEQWARIAAGAARQRGGGLLASALSHAQAARFDAAGHVLTLGFASSQLFYRDALEKPHNQAALLAVLREVLGQEVTLAFERVADAATPAGKAFAPVSRPVPVTALARPASAAPQEIGEAAFEETEIEFDGEGELPLRARGALGASSAPPPDAGVDLEELPVRPPVVAVPKPAAPAPQNPAELRAFEAHPLVKMVLQATDGMIVGVTRK